MRTESACADDRNLRARMAIWAYATGPADPSWRLRPVRWDGTQRRIALLQLRLRAGKARNSYAR
jgi:hypothetical protein